jgi:hypothetical protein
VVSLSNHERPFDKLRANGTKIVGERLLFPFRARLQILGTNPDEPEIQMTKSQ